MGKLLLLLVTAIALVLLGRSQGWPWVVDRRRRDRLKLTGVVAELAGVLKGAKIGDPREEYTEYLRKKYS